MLLLVSFVDAGQYAESETGVHSELKFLPAIHGRATLSAKAKARGYRSLRNLMAMVYLIAGKIDLKLAT